MMSKYWLTHALAATLFLFCNTVYAHYPILDCSVDSGQVSCEASFSDRSKAPDVVMEVFSEDDDVLYSGRTDSASMYRFDLPDGIFFIIMDAGPGHVLEISSDEVEGI